VTTINVNHAKPSPGKGITHEWMANSCEALANHDVKGHMALISKEVKVYEVSKHQIIDYNDGTSQVEHEFNNKLIQSVEFRGDHIRVENPGDIMFTTLEVITGSDGQVINNALEVVLKKENDRVWRVIQERIQDEGESRHFGLT